MSDDHQIHIPPSFHAVHADARGRLRLPLAEFRARYEQCEDLAQMLIEHARTLAFSLGVTEADVLPRIGLALRAPESALQAGEPAWVLQRLAELLDCPWDAAWAEPLG